MTISVSKKRSAERLFCFALQNRSASGAAVLLDGVFFRWMSGVKPLKPLAGSARTRLLFKEK